MPKIILAAIAALLMSRSAYGQAAPAPTHSCESSAQLELPAAKILSAQTVEAGAFNPPPNMTPWMLGDPSFYKTLPAFCRVIAEAKPSADSSIKIEVWMPTNGSQAAPWNVKLEGRGNGGFAGEIDYRALAIAVKKGYAAAGTDTGHAAGHRRHLGPRTSRKSNRFRLPRNPRDDARREGGDQGGLRQGSAAFVLHRLLQWWPPSFDGGAAFS